MRGSKMGLKEYCTQSQDIGFLVLIHLYLILGESFNGCSSSVKCKSILTSFICLIPGLSQITFTYMISSKFYRNSIRILRLRIAVIPYLSPTHSVAQVVRIFGLQSQYLFLLYLADLFHAHKSIFLSYKIICQC